MNPYHVSYGSAILLLSKTLHEEKIIAVARSFLSATLQKHQEKSFGNDITFSQILDRIFKLQSLLSKYVATCKHCTSFYEQLTK